jgi:hypothetical protein
MLGKIARAKGWKMNWRRGAFQLWVVASICWAAYVLWDNYDEFERMDENAAEAIFAVLLVALAPLSIAVLWLLLWWVFAWVFAGFKRPWRGS